MTKPLLRSAAIANVVIAMPIDMSYLYYPCVYCEELFQLIEPENGFRAGGAVRHIVYRNKKTNEIVFQNRSEGVCLECAKEIMRKHKEK
jgi:hypothetical protein